MVTNFAPLEISKGRWKLLCCICSTSIFEE